MWRAECLFEFELFNDIKDMTSNKYLKKQKKTASSKVTSLHFEPRPILQEPLHDDQDRLWKSHTQQRVPYFRVAMHLFKLEKQTSDLCRVLQSP